MSRVGWTMHAGERTTRSLGCPPILSLRRSLILSFSREAGEGTHKLASPTRRADASGVRR